MNWRNTVSAFLGPCPLGACESVIGPGQRSQPGHGAITIQIVPNPIVAQKMSGDSTASRSMWSFVRPAVTRSRSRA